MYYVHSEGITLPYVGRSMSPPPQAVKPLLTLLSTVPEV
jgi:hypothetical protein